MRYHFWAKVVGSAGIGTTAPGSALEINGNLLLSQGANRTISVATTTSNVAGNNLTILGGTAQQSGGAVTNVGALYLAGGTGYGITGSNSGGNVYAYGGPGTGTGASNVNVILAHNGTSAVGSVGIGTTNPAYKLEVAAGSSNAMRLSATTNAFMLIENTSDNLNNHIKFKTPTREWHIGQNIWSQGLDRFMIRDNTASSARLVIDTNGNVGIGTTAPNYKLHNVGTFLTQGSDFELDDGGVNDSTGVRLFSNSGNLYLQNGSGNNIYFRNKTGFTNMTIQNGGNVGIGTTAPANNLHLIGTSSYTAGLKVESSTSDSTLSLKNTSAGGREWWLGSGGNGAGGGPNFYIYDFTSNGVRMTINSAGNVGIGTTSPQAGLQINTSSSYPNNSLRLYDSTDCPAIFMGGATGKTGALHYCGSDASFRWGRHAAGFGSWESNPMHLNLATGNLSINGTLYQNSDERLKTNIRPIKDPLQKLQSINGVLYEWIDPSRGNATQLGVLAQQVEAVFPEAVFTDGSNLNIKSVSYPALVAPLIEAVKKLDVENKKLKDDLNALKSLVCIDHSDHPICKDVKD